MTESTDKQLPDEQQLDDYLKGDSSVSRQYRQLHGAEVPAELDRLVLRQAEDAVKNRPTQGRPAWMRWTAPLAVAASAVLVLSIVVETGLRDDTATEVSGPQAPRATMQAKERQFIENDAEEAMVTEQAAPLSVPSEPPPAAIAPAAPPPQVQPEKRARESAMNFEAPAEAPAEAPRADAQSRRFAPPPVAAPAREMVAAGQSLARSADIAKQELEEAVVTQEAERKQNAAVADQAEREERTAVTAYSGRISAPMRVSSPVHVDPEEWLKEIRELRKENKQEEADREWRRFRESFPNYEVAETDAAREAKK